MNADRAADPAKVHASRSPIVLQREQTGRDFIEQRPAVDIFVQAMVLQRDQGRRDGRACVEHIASLDQLFEQTTIRPDFEALQRDAGIGIVGGIERCCAEITQQSMSLAAMQDIVRIQIAMHDASLMQMACRRCNAVRDTQY